jgi:hypothetical protein
LDKTNINKDLKANFYLSPGDEIWLAANAEVATVLVRSKHPPIQWKLRGGRRSSVEYSTYIERKQIQKSPC